MDKIILQLRRKQSFTALIRSLLPGHILRKALADRCAVSLEQNGVPQPVSLAGASRDEIETRWLFPEGAESFLKFLRIYRAHPEQCRPEPAVRAALRDFLFCQGSLDAPLTKLLEPQTVLNIAGDQSTLPLLLNIPWELADSMPKLGQTGPLAGTLASFPLARIASESVSTVKLVQEKLRVAYCIVESPGEPAIAGAEFDDALHVTLTRRSGVLDVKTFGRTGSPQRLSQLSAELAAATPHIFVIVAHGRTERGRPQLFLDQWTDIPEIARALAAYQRTFLAMLIACDLTFLEEGATAHSGAYSLLKEGIPAVVAMQSKVRADLAAEFLGTTLDSLLKGLSLPMAVAEGRKSMAPSQKAAEAIVDWSFPALFLGSDGFEKTSSLRDYFQFQPSLEALLRSIPRSEPFFARPELQSKISVLIAQPTAGLRAIVGGENMGKTHLIRAVCREATEAAIRSENHAFRPIIYLDLQRYDPIDSTSEMIARIRDRIDEVKPTVTGPALVDLKLPLARGADGSGNVSDPMRQFVELLDAAKCVLILDNPGDSTAHFWNDFLMPCRTLLHSLVVCLDRGVPQGIELPADHVVAIYPFSQLETEAYLTQFRPESAVSADRWFKETAGVPGLLNGLLHGETDGTGSFAKTISRLPVPDQALLFQLAHLSNGVNAALGWDFVTGWSDAHVPSLVRQGLLLQETRIAQEWLSVPGMLVRSLGSSFVDEMRNAAVQLAESFDSKISEGDPTDELLKLADRPGGIPFIHNIQAVLIKEKSDTSLEQARALPILLHERLFQQARWRDAYRLEKRVLAAVPICQTLAEDWIRLAKSEHLLGLASEACDSLKKARELDLTDLDKVDLIVLEVAINKDSGELEPITAVLDKYDNALSLLRHSSDEEERVMGVRANVLYNRGIIRGHWTVDVKAALEDFETAEAEYSTLHNKSMVAMCKLEWVEVQFRSDAFVLNWPALFDKLVQACDLLEEAGALQDRAFCEYQLARYYRRKPFGNPEESRENVIRARSAYQKCVETARLAGDSRQEMIALGHVVEISWRFLRDMSEPDAHQTLQEVEGGLETFRGDAWSARVKRDMLLLRAQVECAQSLPDDMIATLATAWNSAIKPPLKPEEGTDARRAACILTSYLKELKMRGDGLQFDIAANHGTSFVEQWLNRPVGATPVDTWLAEVEVFGAGPGEYHGKPAR
jgi:hypothetical protein